MMMEDKTLLCAIGMICVTAIEGIAIATHADGQYFLPVIAAIGLLAGVAGFQMVRPSAGPQKK